jgi:exodeoxyribonuclease VII large subunit
VALRARQAIARKSETLEEWAGSVQRSARRSIHEARKEIRRAGTDIERLVAEALARQSTSLVHLASTLNALHPDRTLERGFSLVRDAQGQVVRNADSLEIGATIEVETYTHRLNAQITSIEIKNSKTLPDSQS